MRTSVYRGTAGLLVFALGCATGKSATPAATPSTEVAEQKAPAPPPVPKMTLESWNELVAREQPNLSKQSVDFRGQTIVVDAVSAPIVTLVPGGETSAEAYSMTLPLGTQIPAQCSMANRATPMAGAIWRVVERLKQGQVKPIAVRPSAVLAVEEHPAVGLEILYETPGNGGTLRGVVKLWSLLADEQYLFCTHDEVGYTKTFERAFGSLAREMIRISPAVAKPEQVQISVVKIQNQPVGVSWERRFAGEKKTFRTATVEALFIPRGPTDLMTNDRREWSQENATGRIEKGAASSWSNGEVESTLEYNRQGKSATYSYQGIHSEKPVSGSFKAPDKAGLPGGELVTRWVEERILSGKKPSLSVDVYSPALNFAAVTNNLNKKSPNGERVVTIETGPMTMTLTLDKKGNAERIEVPFGPVTMVQEQLFLRDDT